jgi:hypothetical protein
MGIRRVLMGVAVPNTRQRIESGLKVDGRGGGGWFGDRIYGNSTV